LLIYVHVYQSAFVLRKVIACMSNQSKKQCTVNM